MSTNEKRVLRWMQSKGMKAFNHVDDIAKGAGLKPAEAETAVKQLESNGLVLHDADHFGDRGPAYATTMRGENWNERRLFF